MSLPSCSTVSDFGYRVELTGSPAKALAVTLDVGTNNQDLLDDPLYMGYREKRVRGQGYDSFVDKFVGLVKKYQPKCLLHFEDFVSTSSWTDVWLKDSRGYPTLNVSWQSTETSTPSPVALIHSSLN